MFMDPCIADESVEFTFPTQPWRRLVATWEYKPEAANTV
jgi:hypothetical protein